MIFDPLISQAHLIDDLSLPSSSFPLLYEHISIEDSLWCYHIITFVSLIVAQSIIVSSLHLFSGLHQILVYELSCPLAVHQPTQYTATTLYAAILQFMIVHVLYT